MFDRHWMRYEIMKRAAAAAELSDALDATDEAKAAAECIQAQATV